MATIYLNFAGFSGSLAAGSEGAIHLMLRRAIVCFASLALTLVIAAPRLLAQESRGEPIGALRVTGEVYVNDSPVTGQVTLFASDAVRTGAKGAAGLTIPGRGMLTIGAQTRISFGVGSYFAKLEAGNVGIRTLAGAKTIDIQFGQFVVIQETEVEAAAEVTLASDGSAQVQCTEGTVGIINLSGPQSPFIHPGDSVSISSSGEMQVNQVPLAPANTSNLPQVSNTGSHKTAWILLGVAGAGGAAAAVALASSGHKAAVSPSAP